MWDIDTLDCVRVLEGHNEAVLALAVGPSFLVSGSYDTTVRFWALESLRCVRYASMPVLNACPQNMQSPCRHAKPKSPASEQASALWYVRNEGARAMQLHLNGRTNVREAMRPLWEQVGVC